MANEIQRIYWNSQASPVASANLESGTFTLAFGGDTTPALDYNADAAAIQVALEALSSIGSGNVLVTPTVNGFTVEFRGALADTNVEELTIDTSLLKQKADTITITVVQNGIASVPCVPSIGTIVSAVAPVGCVPSITTTTTAVSPVDEIQQVNLNGATSGTFDLNGNSTSAMVVSLDTIGIQTACDTIWGTGNTSVSSLGGGAYLVTFGGSLAGANVGEMTVTNNNTDGSPSVSTYTDGVAGVHQVDEITFDSTAAAGAMTIDGDSCAWNQTANGQVFVSGATVSATTPASGSITITWNDYSSHSPVSITQGSLLSVVGVHQVDGITFNSTAVAGSMTIDGDSCAWNQPANEAVTITGATVTASSPANGSINISWDDYDPHTPVSVSQGTLVSVAGLVDIATVSLDDEPTEGSYRLVQGLYASAVVALTDDASAIVGRIGSGNLPAASFSCVGSPPWSYTLESSGPVAAVWWGGTEEDPLRKPLSTAQVVTVQSGGGGGGEIIGGGCGASLIGA